MQDPDVAEVILRRETDFAIGASVYVVRGEEAILRLQMLLVQFSEQLQSASGTLLDLSYFLQKPGFLKRVPYLFVVAKRSHTPVSKLTLDDLVGTVLLFEFHFCGLGIQAYATNDRSGTGSLLSLPQDRARVTALICGVLVGHGARVAMLSFAGGDAADVQQEPVFREMGRKTRRIRWAVRHRQMPAYLQLQSTFDQTLARLGQKTRSNMRYYRRRAERDLGCTVTSMADTPVDELVLFNRSCMYPIREATLRWRLQVLRTLHRPILMGLKDREGRWLSVLAGRRFGQTSELLWQMNRDGYPSQSLSTVMRSYWMEQEIAQGACRLQIEGGTFHSMAHSFEEEQIVDLVLVRAIPLRVLCGLVRRLIPRENSLAEMLRSGDLEWHEGHQVG